MMLGLGDALPCCASEFQCANPGSPAYCDNSSSCCAGQTGPSGSTVPAPAAAGASCITTDPGFMIGLESWTDFSQWSGNVSDVTSLPTWMCYPMMNLGIVVAPVAAVGLLLFTLGRASKRR